MTSCPEAMDWDSWWFWKKAVSWDLSLGEASWDLKLDEASQICGQRYLPRVCWVRWNGQYSKNCVSLSPRVERLNSRSQLTFRTWTKESRQCFGIPLHIWIFHIFVFSYVTSVHLLPSAVSSDLYRCEEMLIILDIFQNRSINNIEEERKFRILVWRAI